MTDSVDDESLARVERSFARLGQLAKAASRSQASLAHPELQPAGWWVFRAVMHGQPIAVSEIICDTGMDKSVVSRHLKTLREYGLVEVTRGDDDARVMVVSLSSLGQERAAAFRARIRNRYRRALSGWDATDVAKLAELLERLAPSLDEAIGGTQP